ncbi:adenylosuccinate lyase [Gelidibacter maritimus]|uniref:Adenylosuccinate lyase n=1 Tax=Gelidibacter maritimus TaxID=2761487 RepID=A0A7W2R216_9FLAO|nr:adenylosuccinate lyase [Gelidibacter maritimus]MBA6151302.1 adenylosuccinate lyase [Gelidibacter maritimus]
MTTDQLYAELNYVDHSRANRLKYANLILEQPELIPELLSIVFKVDDKTSCKAAWILEFVCSENLEAFIPYLELFTENIYRVHLDSAVRPVAKICEYLTKAYYSKTEETVLKVLSDSHKDLIITACFDWMISDEKVATKAYSMNTLYLFGQDFDWIHPELTLILERDFHRQSAGFKARARQILTKIKKEYE